VDHLLEAVRITALAGLLYLLGAGIVDALRSGTVRLRGGIKAGRRSHPVTYWLSIATGCLFVGLCLWVLVQSLADTLFGLPK
jgi:hypothetical protein